MEESILKSIERQRAEARVFDFYHKLAESPEHEIAKHRAFEYWKKEINLALMGYQVGSAYIKENPSIFNDSVLKGITLADCFVEDLDLKKITGKDQVDKIASGSISLLKVWFKSANVLPVFYTIGQKLFEQKKFLDSYYIFSFLTLLNQNNPSFWVGRAAASESMQNWNSALNEYWAAESLGLDDPVVYQGLIRIYTKVKDKNGLSEVFEIIHNKPDLKRMLLQK